jgi:PadR family transcriptional regulator, regulatory protein PadR
MGDASLSLLRGTLDLLVLRSLAAGPRHGYAISEWLESATDGTLLLEEGTLYPALHRLEGKGWLEAEWGVSENNRRAKYYRLTLAGQRRLAEEAASWTRYADAVAKALRA